MNRVKKMIYFSLLLIVLCIGYSLHYFNQYHIDDSNVSIQSNLNNWLNRGNREQINANLIEVVRLNDSNSYIVLFQLENDDIGYSQLIKGLNGKFKIELVGYGTNVVSYEDIRTNEGVYGILLGKNPSLKINHIFTKLIHEEFNFTTDVSKDELFVKYEKLPSELRETFPAEFIFYDGNNTVIP
ncbi:hypothetical protein A8L34_00760 [Bacillus sp. FJAT-27264]|uniref:hypothetical protein n=1 Tax=Paenibacillus sp. (strain DSM 101736 / FJAT-27264) TaxID=1850362 RepID=UPI000807D03D|nr:hypothetical protein [Bacillus sp. FJAT-27264]OBZ18152.1 hypothetical protein A8L34_00760 [Bacillus sp. FJAT-27264]